MMKYFYKTCILFALVSLSTNLHSQYDWAVSAEFELPDGWGLGATSIVDADTIWAVAIKFFPLDLNYTPIFYHTTDGGASWESKEMTGITGKAILSMEALSGTTVIVATNDFAPWYGPGGTKELYKTTDGGDTWEVVLQNNSGGVHLHFFDPQSGICANQDDIAYTEDGGDSWTLVDRDSIPDLNPGELAGHFMYSSPAGSLAASGDTLWLGTNQGRILKSTNRGRFWQAFDTGLGSNQFIYSLAFSDAQNGLLGYGPIDDRKLARTTDGGENWEPIVIPAVIRPREIFYVPGTESTFVGLSFTAPNQTTFLSNYGEEWIILNDTLSISSASFASINLGFSIGDRNEPGSTSDIYKWTTTTNTETISSLQAVSVFPNPFVSELTIQSEEVLIQHVSLYDVSGKVFDVQNDLQTNAHQFAVPNLPAGVYFLDIATDAGRLIKKVVKE